MAVLDPIRRTDAVRPLQGWAGGAVRPQGGDREGWAESIRAIDPVSAYGSDADGSFDQGSFDDQLRDQERRQNGQRGFARPLSAGTLAALIDLAGNPDFAAANINTRAPTTQAQAADRYAATAAAADPVRPDAGATRAASAAASTAAANTSTSAATTGLFGLFTDFLANRPEASAVVAAYRSVQAVRADQLGRDLAISRVG